MVFGFKNRNHFSKIKTAFSIKPKIVFVNYYFSPNQTLENTKIILYQNKRNLSWKFLNFKKVISKAIKKYLIRVIF